MMHVTNGKKKPILHLVSMVHRLKVQHINCKVPAKWIYTGYTYEKLASGECKHTEVTDEILDSIDVLVDGRFVNELKSLQLKFRGSENQRILDMKQIRKCRGFVDIIQSR